MRRPVIGITMDTSDRAGRYELPQAYSAAVEAAGGMPLLIPYKTDSRLIPQILDLLDGVLFSGGDDLDPALYGEQSHFMAERIDPARQTFELALLAEVERRRTPALGICLGSQLMNVHRKGSLIQFLPDVERAGAIEHRRVVKGEENRHEVMLEPGSKLAGVLGKQSVLANSSHKQAVKTPGKGLRVSAKVIGRDYRGIEDPAFPLFLGVQWHPERLHNEAEHSALFKLLVDVARGSKTQG